MGAQGGGVPIWGQASFGMMSSDEFFSRNEVISEA